MNVQLNDLIVRHNHLAKLVHGITERYRYRILDFGSTSLALRGKGQILNCRNMGNDTINNVPLTKEFLEKILRKKITSLKIGEGSNPGDNFLTILFSLEVRVNDEKEPLHLLFKTFPYHPSRQKILCETNLFLKEFLVYKKWIPALINFQENIVGSERVLYPAVPELVAGNGIDYTNTENVDLSVDPLLSNFVLMMDVRKTHGFKMASKLEGLSYGHAKVALEELAKLHALGYSYKKCKGLTSILEAFPFMEDPIFHGESQRTILASMFQGNFQLITSALQSFYSNRPDIEESFKRFENKDTSMKLIQAFTHPNGLDEEAAENLQRIKKFAGPPLKEQWIVPGHGDCWTNNMLFKKNESGKVTDAILVDLQLARECCIMADLTYFFYSSTDTKFRESHLDEMMEWYYERFVNYCSVLGIEPFDGFTIENFKRKFHRSKIFGLLFAVIVIPTVLSGTAVDMDKAEVVEGEGEKDAVASMLTKKGNRDENDMELLRERFTALLAELYEEGVI